MINLVHLQGLLNLLEDVLAPLAPVLVYSRKKARYHRIYSERNHRKSNNHERDDPDDGQYFLIHRVSIARRLPYRMTERLEQ